MADAKQHAFAGLWQKTILTAFTLKLSLDPEGCVWLRDQPCSIDLLAEADCAL